MNSFELKLIAIITMLIDHIGAVLFPDVEWLRMIGRLAFPIFAYLVSEGFFKTSDVKKYMKRLFIFALISQVPFYLAFNEKYHLNIYFTLFLGLYAVYMCENTNKSYYIWLMGLIGQVIGADYGIYGVLTIYIFYKYHEDFKDIVKYQVILNLAYASMNILGYASYGGKLSLQNILSVSIQALSLVSLLLIKLYNGERGYSLKYVFYVFYPAHLFILYLIDKFR